MKEEKLLKCRDCGSEFLFSVPEQEFFEEKGFVNEPSRCPACRQARRTNGNRERRAERRLYSVICADCGKESEVPFQPSHDRPVYCRECFAKHKNN